MIIVKENIYEQIVEKFMHHIASKLNVSNLLIELNYSKDDILKSVQEMEGIFLLYRYILIQNSEVHVNEAKMKAVFVDKSCELICRNLTDYTKQKAILLYLIYNSNIIENTTVTLNTSSVVYENNDHLKILELDSVVIHEWRSFFKTKILFLYDYTKTNSSITFHINT